MTEDYQEPEVKLDYTSANHGYTGLDRFNRVVDQLWEDYSQTALDEFTYTYDRSSNALTRVNALDAAFSETYGYDDADRLTSSERADDYDQSWTLDGMGNWTSFDDDGATTNSTFNDINENVSVPPTPVACSIRSRPVSDSIATIRRIGGSSAIQRRKRSSQVP